MACGHDFTLVATMSYDGPDEEEVDRLQDEEIVREEAERRKEREEVGLCHSIALFGLLPPFTFVS